MLFAYSTILGWEYNGEKAWEYLWGTHTYNIIYRLAFSLVVYVGATQTLDLVWNLSDIANALMAVPNLVSMLVLAPVIKEEVLRFEAVIAKEKAGRKAALLERMRKRYISEQCEKISGIKNCPGSLSDCNRGKKSVFLPHETGRARYATERHLQ